MLATLYTGNLYVWNYLNNTLAKSFEVGDLPVRSSKFVARKQWIVAGADDMLIRVFNYNTLDKVKTFEAHSDYIRCVAVHPTLPCILSSSDDMTIKLWDWDKGWACTQIFEGHSHYVMQVVFNPKDTNTFASASLDRTVKIWSLGQPVPNFTLEGHEKGVNCIDYFTGGDRPYLISGADDKLVKIWDYQTKACVQTLSGHSHNVSAVSFHPDLPIIVTGSEDGTVRIWHSTTYRLENTLNHGLERVWSISTQIGSNFLAIGYDEGTVMIKIGREEPVASMDPSGKIIWAKHNEIQTVNLKQLAGEEIVDGERLALTIKELGSCDLYPQTLQHSPNGRFVTVCGDGEYVIYTALAWRNKSFGTGQEFVWSNEANDYAVRESSSRIKLFKNFKEADVIRTPFAAEGIHGGSLLGVRGSDFVCFYDWFTGKIIRRIDVECKQVYWSESGELLVLTSESSFFILRYDPEVVASMIESGEEPGEDGFEDAFDLIQEISEQVRSAFWVGDCFIYNNSSWRLNYCVGGEVSVLHHLDRPMFLLGYMSNQQRVFLLDKQYGVVSFTLLLSLIEYKTLVIRGDMDSAAETLKLIPTSQLDSIARFLESRGLLDEALEVAQDADYKFDLAIQLGKLDLAQELAVESDSQSKWKQLGELALSAGELDVAQQCLVHAKDLAGLLLLYSSRGDAAGMEALSNLALAEGKHNVAFTCLLMLGKLDECLDMLIESGRIPEAAFMARTYLPSRVPDIVKLWREDVKKVNTKAAESLADPAQYPNLFQGYDSALQIEEQLKAKRNELLPAELFPEHENDTKVDLVEQLSSLHVEDAVNGTNDGEYSDANEVEEDMEHGDDIPEELGGTIAIDESPAEDEVEVPSVEDAVEDFGSVEVEPSEGIREELIEEDMPAEEGVVKEEAAVDQYAEDNFEAAMEEMEDVMDQGPSFEKPDSPIFGQEDTYDEDLDDDWGLDEEVESKQD